MVFSSGSAGCEDHTKPTVPLGFFGVWAAAAADAAAAAAAARAAAMQAASAFFGIAWEFAGDLWGTSFETNGQK